MNDVTKERVPITTSESDLLAHNNRGWWTEKYLEGDSYDLQRALMTTVRIVGNNVETGNGRLPNRNLESRRWANLLGVTKQKPNAGNIIE